MPIPGKQRDRRGPSSKAGKVPLTYYRSGTDTPGRSPFEKKLKSPSRARKYLIRLADVLLLVVILFGLIYSMVVRPQPLVLSTSSAYHSASTYEAASAKQLAEFKNRNKITFNEQGIIESLEAQFPEIAIASIELPLFGQSPTIRLTISQPIFWLNSNNSLYVINDEGKAVGKNTTLPQIKNLPVVIDESGFNIQQGKQVLDAQAASFIGDLIRQCRKANVAIQSLTLPARPQELILRTSDKGYFVKFFLNGDSKQQIGQFLAARQQFDRSGSQPAEYLDVRVTGKIFYK